MAETAIAGTFASVAAHHAMLAVPDVIIHSGGNQLTELSAPYFQSELLDAVSDSSNRERSQLVEPSFAVIFGAKGFPGFRFWLLVSSS